MTSDWKARIATLDARLRKLAKPINVLKHLNWPIDAEEKFLRNWSDGRPALPEVAPRSPDWTEDIQRLDEFAAECAADDAVATPHHDHGLAVHVEDEIVAGLWDGALVPDAQPMAHQHELDVVPVDLGRHVEGLEEGAALRLLPDQRFDVDLHV